MAVQGINTSKCRFSLIMAAFLCHSSFFSCAAAPPPCDTPLLFSCTLDCRSNFAPFKTRSSLYIYPTFCTTASSGSARTEERPALASISSSLSDIIATLSPLMTYSPNGTVSGSASGLYTLSEASFNIRF